jgi:hypothetical protein
MQMQFLTVPLFNTGQQEQRDYTKHLLSSSFYLKVFY